MRTINLPGAEFDSSILGLGCAGLFRLPSKAHRRRLLEHAYAAGVTHFDVAPMYGLGIAESELGRFAKGRRDHITIVTKFGIVPAPAAKVLARVQGPARRVFAAVPALREQARARARGPGSGSAGSLLYTARGYDATSAKTSLEASLRTLATDYIDLFLLHDPSPSDVRSDELYAYLEGAQDAGQIRSWGVAGEVRPSIELARSLPGRVPVLQVRNDIFQNSLPAIPPDRALALIAFGVLAEALPRLVAFVTASTARRQRWSALLGRDCGSPQTIASLLLRDALHVNPTGVTLFSTTRLPHIDVAIATASDDPMAEIAELEVFRELVTELPAS